MEGKTSFLSFFFSSRRWNNASRALSSFTYSSAPPQPPPRVHLPSPALLLLVSNRVPAYEVKRKESAYMGEGVVVR